ncbi:hypothetical protein [Apibacter sp. HY039]|uniref:hypothetical protein n=1 Tax=Apibacter sp. HY039 TaxID=2501476 RepID=UPI000FEBDA4B|nr:hypothetical protein [Apibacter sp. HY039]
MKNFEITDIEVLPNTKELVMQQTEPWEDLLLGYYKVLKISDDLWYMWYQAWENLKNTDYGSKLCFAYSTDGKNWIKKIPDGNFEDNIIVGRNSSLKQGWVEIDVFFDKNDKKYPFRALYNKKTDVLQQTFMSKSKNGWEWVDEIKVFETYHDSQFSVKVLSNGNYLVLLRLWSGELYTSNRIIGSAIITPEGDIYNSPKELLSSNIENFSHLYTSSAHFFSDDNFIMIPTVYSNNDKISIRTAYYLNGKAYLNKTDITDALYQKQEIGWGNVCPGLISTGEENTYWMYYYGRVGTHNNVKNYTTYYYRIKVKTVKK